MKTYSNTINSDIEWIGKVPDHWEVKKIKRDTVIMRGASPRPIDDDIYFDINGEFAWVRISDVTASNGILQKTEQRLSNLGSSLSVKLDVGELFLSIAGSVGKQCITKIPCCIHDGFVYFPKLKMLKKFLYYIFEGGECYSGLGKMGTQLNLNTDTVGDIQIPYPPNDEQKQIIDYLDVKLREIDNAVDKIQKLIKLLNEKRQNTINYTITQGLDLTLPKQYIKPIPRFLDIEISKHWKVFRLSELSDEIKDGPMGFHLHKSDYVESGIPIIQIRNLQNLNVNKKSLKFISTEKHQKLKKSQVRYRDIIISKTGKLGMIGIVPENYGPANLNQALARIHLKDKSIVEFVARYMSSELIQSILTQWGTGRAIQDGLRMSDIKALKIPLPSELDCVQILKYLRDELQKIDSLILTTESQIKRLQEFRQSLISSAVTGKMDLRKYPISA